MTGPETKPAGNPNPIPAIVVSPTSEIPILTQEMVEYLNDRATELGISFSEAYQEEMDARAIADREAFNIDELQALAACSAAKPHLVDGDEECPF